MQANVAGIAKLLNDGRCESEDTDYKTSSLGSDSCVQAQLVKDAERDMKSMDEDGEMWRDAECSTLPTSRCSKALENVQGHSKELRKAVDTLAGE